MAGFKTAAEMAHEYILAGLQGGVVLRPDVAFRMAREFLAVVAPPVDGVDRKLPEVSVLVEHQICDHIAHRRKIAAIRDLRAATGLGLMEAKDRIEAVYGV